MRLKNLTPFYVMQILKDASKYDDAIHFEVGQPDLPPSPKVLEAAKEAIEKGPFGYTPAEGLQELRTKIAWHYKHRYGLAIDPKRIVVTPGSSGAFTLAYALTTDIGQKLAIADPGYPSYKNFAYMLGIDPLFIPVEADTNYCITPEHLRGRKIDTLQISSPANPTGSIYSKELLQELAKYCSKHGITLISDELYSGLVYESEFVSTLQISEEAIVIDGFSKSFCMPGFRLGWVVLPPHLVQKARELAQNIFLAPPTISQYAALEAFDYDYLEHVRQTFQKRRDLLYELLSPLFDLGAKPQGAFYIWADVRRYGKSTELAKIFLEKTHVAVTPGIDFSQRLGEDFLRFAYTIDKEKMREGVARIASLLGQIGSEDIDSRVI